jgi:predicted HicB family RNase H-like nuclease
MGRAHRSLSRRPAVDELIYKGFIAGVRFDDNDRIFVGRLVGINDVVGFHAGSVQGLTAAFHAAVDDYVATCEAAGK